MTVLFCDLVGFTARAESARSRGRRPILRPYHATASAPSSSGAGARWRSSSATRSWRCSARPSRTRTIRSGRVRAALAIRDLARRGRARAARRDHDRRGARLARMRARTRARGWPSGDVVNTAARLQSAAPVNGVIVDETTYRATRARDRLPRGGAGRREGKGRADRGLGGARGSLALRHGGPRPRRAASSSAASASSLRLRGALDRVRGGALVRSS